MPQEPPATGTTTISVTSSVTWGLLQEKFGSAPYFMNDVALGSRLALSRVRLGIAHSDAA
jgi:hypothetical protein